MQRSFTLQGHRGARGLFPENTIEGFAATMALGVHGLELDVAITADGVPVVSHDPDLDPDLTRTADGRWLEGERLLIRHLTLAEIKSFDVGRIRPGSALALAHPQQRPRDGARIPTLAEVFALTAGSTVRVDAELKLRPERPEASVSGAAMADAVLACARAAGALDRLDLRSFDWLALRYAGAAAPWIRRTYLSRRFRPELASFYFDRALDGTISATLAGEAAGREICWAPEWMTLTEALLADSQARGIPVMPWTVNDPAEMQRFIGWGVDGFCTDRPDLARAAMAQAGLTLPTPQ